MSLSHLNRLLGSILLVLVLTLSGSAQQGFRPWAHYARDEFGGGPRQVEGLYGVIEGIDYTFAPVKNIYVGATNDDGSSKQREVYTGNTTITQTNSIHASQIASVNGMSTRAEIGYMKGHHGWYFDGYELADMETTLNMPNASMVIDDVFNMVALTYMEESSQFNTVWQPDGGYKTIPGATSFNQIPIYDIGHLWGWIPLTYEDGTQGRLAPLPINFENTATKMKMNHWNIEAMYVYRSHPIALGSFDFIGGVRYMEVNDSMDFQGVGELTSGDSIGSILGDCNWKFLAENHIVAPQIGMRYSKRNGRWTLSGEAKFIAGFNTQNLLSEGTYATNLSGATELFSGSHIYPYAPLGPMGGGPASGVRSFYYKETRNDFSPGVEAKISANWQLTNALGFQVGFNIMWMDKIARGAYINDYRVNEDGTFFGIKDDGYSDSILMYGINFGVTINRW